MMRTDVTAWLSSRPRDYLTGVQIFLKYTTDKALIALFTKEAATDFKREKLNEVMQALVQPFVTLAIPISIQQPVVPPTPPVQAKPKKAEPVKFSELHKGWPNPITDPAIEALWAQWKPLFAELMSLQARLAEVALQGEKGDTVKEMEAGQMLHRMMDLDEAIFSIYEQRDFYIEHHRLPEKKPDTEVVTDPTLWPLKMQNHMRYAREFRGKINTSQTLIALLKEQGMQPGIVEKARKLLPKSLLKKWNNQLSDLINLLLQVSVDWQGLLEHHQEQAMHYKKLLKQDE